MAEPTVINTQITDAAAPETAVPESAAAQPPVGKFVWHDLMTSDVEKAQKYYADLLGWTYKEFDMGPGGKYSMIHAGDTEWGGFVPLDPAHGVPPHWISYVNVLDVDAAAAKAEELGGKAPVPGTDIPTVGRFAVIESPGGAYVSPYQSENPQAEGPDPAPVPGTFCWHELLATDPEVEGKFFSEIFGWRIEEMPMGELGMYYLFKRLDTGKDAGGMLKKPDGQGPSAWLPYILVESADATAARTEELGGTVWVTPTDIPGVGRFIVTTDPQGAYIAFLQPPG